MQKANRKNWIGVLAGLAVGLVLSASIYLGSQGLKHFDRAVFWYAAGSVLAAFAVGYRFAIWAQRPPSRMYFLRGLELLFRGVRKGRSTCGLRTGENDPLPWQNSVLAGAFTKNFVAQNFIRKRGLYRWIMHLCLSGGCTLAFAITFPLVFGWVHFESIADNAEIYRVSIFGFSMGTFDVHGITGFIAFNLLNFSAVMVLAGLVLAALRRLTDAGERATQKFTEDMLPLLLIFAVAMTGLMLTASYQLLSGQGHSWIAVAHMLSVLALLGFIPFGKLFHMFQRLCSLCVSIYKRAGESGARALCAGCGADFASAMHVADLKTVLDQLGFNYRFATQYGELHYQDICPPCRRRLLALNQGRTLGR